MKKFILVFFLLFAGLTAALFLKAAARWPSGPLSALQKQINSQVGIVHKTGIDSQVTFAIPDEDGILVISPAYADIFVLGKDIFSLELLKEMQSSVTSRETGHLFYIRSGRLAEHRLLSGLAEPILGMSRNKKVVFQISRTPNSGRPVTIEIVNQ